jgi:hypothetical protein
MKTTIAVGIFLFIIYRIIRFNRKEKSIIILFNEPDFSESDKPNPTNPKFKKFKFCIYYKKCQFFGIYHNETQLTDDNLKPFVLHYETAKGSFFTNEFDCFYQFKYDLSNKKADFYFDVITNTTNPFV